MKITSRDNRRLVHARKVRDGRVPEQILIEGRRLVAEALRSNLAIDQCFVSDAFRGDELLPAATDQITEIIEVSERLFDTIADTDQPQGIILLARRPETSPDAVDRRVGQAALPIVLFLKQINNPSNLGAILRTAEAVDAAGVILSRGSADAFSTKALRSAMGASFRVSIWEGAEFDEVLSWARARNLAVTAADISAAEDYSKTNWKIPRLLIFGSEAQGLSESDLSKIDNRVLIPLENQVESLNLAVSAGVILFEAKRQMCG